MSCARRCRAISRRSPRSSKTRATCRRKPQQDGDQLVSQQDLDKMLNNIQKLAQSGSKDMAERMLSELKDILDRLADRQFRRERAAAARRPHDEGFERHRLQSAEAARRHFRRQAPAGRAQRRAESQQFEVSPPGQPMEFGPGMSMAPLFEEMPGEAQQGVHERTGRIAAARARRARSGQLEIGQQPQAVSASASMPSSASVSRSFATGCKA